MRSLEPAPVCLAVTSLGGGLVDAYFDQTLAGLPLQAGAGPWLIRLNNRYQTVTKRRTIDANTIRLTTIQGASFPGAPYCWYSPPPNDAVSVAGIPALAFEQAIVI